MTNYCEDLRPDFSAFKDDELAESRKSEISDHIRSCLPCRNQINELKALSNLLESSNTSLAVPDLWERLSSQAPSMCEIVSEDLSAYLDNELSAEGRDGIDDHLSNCAQCSQSLSQLQATSNLLARGLELNDNMEVDLWGAIRSSLHEKCADIQGDLSAFADQEVNIPRHREVVAHLLDCPLCKEQFDHISFAGSALRSHYVPEIAADFDIWPSVRNKLEIAQFKSRNRISAKGDAVKQEGKVLTLNRRVQFVSAAAFVLMTIAGSTMFMRGPSSPPPVSAESYLVQSALSEPSSSAELVVYENQ